MFKLHVFNVSTRTCSCSIQRKPPYVEHEKRTSVQITQVFNISTRTCTRSIHRKPLHGEHEQDRTSVQITQVFNIRIRENLYMANTERTYQVFKFNRYSTYKHLPFENNIFEFKFKGFSMILKQGLLIKCYRLIIIVKSDTPEM